jgi:hypothetical protein
MTPKRQHNMVAGFTPESHNNQAPGHCLVRSEVTKMAKQRLRSVGVIALLTQGASLLCAATFVFFRDSPEIRADAGALGILLGCFGCGLGVYCGVRYQEPLSIIAIVLAPIVLGLWGLVIWKWTEEGREVRAVRCWPLKTSGIFFSSVSPLLAEGTGTGGVLPQRAGNGDRGSFPARQPAQARAACLAWAAHPAVAGAGVLACRRGSMTVFSAPAAFFDPAAG